MGRPVSGALAFGSWIPTETTFQTQWILGNDSDGRTPIKMRTYKKRKNERKNPHSSETESGWLLLPLFIGGALGARNRKRCHTFRRSECACVSVCKKGVKQPATRYVGQRKKRNQHRSGFGKIFQWVLSCWVVLKWNAGPNTMELPKDSTRVSGYWLSIFF